MSKLKRLIRIIRDPYSRPSLWNSMKSTVLQRGKASDINDVIDIKTFWENAHRQKKQLWLTGSPPQEVIRRLDVESEIKDSEFPILDVGVGLGLMARYLFDSGKAVEALDISVTALERAKPYVSATFLDASELPNDHFALIMHHLVAQHMADASLKTQIKDLRKSLKVGGVIALQFSAPLNQTREQPINLSLSDQAGGMVMRTSEEMTTLIESVGGNIHSVSPREIWTKYDSQYWVVKFS